MEYFIGIVVAVAVLLYTKLVGFHRDRALYTVMVLVVASYYVLFAVISGSSEAIGWDTLIFSVFAFIAAIGFRTNLWLAAGALVGHGLLDFFHTGLIENSGVPAWWPMFCMTFDIVAGLYLAWLLQRSSVMARFAGSGPERSYLSNASSSGTRNACRNRL